MFLFTHLRGKSVEGFLLSASRPLPNHPDLLCDIHPKCRSGLPGCYVVAVCHREGNFLPRHDVYSMLADLVIKYSSLL